MTFTFFSNNSCDGQGVGKGTVTLVSGVAHPSQASGARPTGDYAFQGHYNGDANFDASTSPCEPFHVDKADTTTVTDIHDTAHQVVLSAPIFPIVHDKATVTGNAAGGTPTGDVTFTVYMGTKDCDVEAAKSTDQATVDWTGAVLQIRRCRSWWRSIVDPRRPTAAVRTLQPVDRRL